MTIELLAYREWLKLNNDLVNYNKPNVFVPCPRIEYTNCDLCADGLRLRNCPYCHGTGKVKTHPDNCDLCHGNEDVEYWLAMYYRQYLFDTKLIKHFSDDGVINWQSLRGSFAVLK